MSYAKKDTAKDSSGNIPRIELGVTLVADQRGIGDPADAQPRRFPQRHSADSSRTAKRKGILLPKPDQEQCLRLDQSLRRKSRSVSAFVPDEIAALAERGDHPAEPFVQFDGRPGHLLGAFRGVLEIADDLQRHIGRVRPFHPHLDGRTARDLPITFP